MASHLNPIPPVERNTHGALDANAVDPDTVARRVDDHGFRQLGVQPDLEVIPRDGEIVTQQDPVGVVDAGAFATDEDPVVEGPGGLAGTPGVDNEVTERLALTRHCVRLPVPSLLCMPQPGSFPGR